MPQLPLPASGFRSLLVAPAPWLVLLAVLVLQLPLALNPGYFSHDELQWAYFSTLDRTVPWLDVSPFQYRPLTFNLWMWLSRHLFQAPQAFHAVLVAWGAANTTAVYAVGRKLGVDARAAGAGALAFALSPYAVMAHGWVGTIADLAWLSCALVVMAATLWIRWRWAIALVAALATATGLLAKEAALAIPAVCAVACAFDRQRARWLAATAGAVLAAGVYASLRMDVLLHTTNLPDLYAAKFSNIPLRWIEYQAFTPLVRTVEAHITLQAGARWLALAALLWVAWLAALWRAHPRLALLWIVGGGAALGPVLLLGQASDHYGYGFAAVTALCGAAAWARTARWGRVAIAAYAAFAILHGLVVMAAVVEVGRVQSVFSPGVAQALRARPLDAPPLRLRPDPDSRDWMFKRLTHDIPAYDGVPMGARVRLVEATEAADLDVAADGSLRPAR